MAQTYNFYATVDIDGRQSQLAAGPKAKDGGMRGSIKMRNKGKILDAIRFQCRALDNGDLVLEVYPGSTEAELITQVITDDGLSPMLRITTKR